MRGTVFLTHPVPLKFGPNRDSNSWDIVGIEFAVVVVGGVKSPTHHKIQDYF